MDDQMHIKVQNNIRIWGEIIVLRIQRSAVRWQGLLQTAHCKYKMVMTIAGARAGLDGDSVQIRYYTASAWFCIIPNESHDDVRIMLDDVKHRSRKLQIYFHKIFENGTEQICPGSWLTVDVLLGRAASVSADNYRRSVTRRSEEIKCMSSIICSALQVWHRYSQYSKKAGV